MGTDCQTWEGIIGRHDTSKCNSNGLLLLKTCATHDLVITNTMFCFPTRNDILDAPAIETLAFDRLCHHKEEGQAGCQSDKGHKCCRLLDWSSPHLVKVPTSYPAQEMTSRSEDCKEAYPSPSRKTTKLQANSPNALGQQFAETRTGSRHQRDTSCSEYTRATSHHKRRKMPLSAQDRKFRRDYARWRMPGSARRPMKFRDMQTATTPSVSTTFWRLCLDPSPPTPPSPQCRWGQVADRKEADPGALGLALWPGPQPPCWNQWWGHCSPISSGDQPGPWQPPNRRSRNWLSSSSPCGMKERSLNSWKTSI